MSDPALPRGGRSVGVMAPRDLDPALLTGFARRAEEVGFDELWVVEDLGYAGGLAQATIVLAATDRLHVGIGVAPAAVRNAAFLAMEAATLARAFPGRFTLGVGHGMADWMRQVGAGPVGSVGLLEQYVATVRSILAGETVDADGPHVRMRGFGLEAPPTVTPGVLAGVRGPRSLAASGRVADGTILAEPVTPEYATAARRAIGATRPHRVVGYNLGVVDPDPAAARDLVRPALTVVGERAWAPHVEVLPFHDELVALRAASADAATFVAAMPDAWVDQLALVGDATSVARRIDALHDAGVDSVVMAPVAADPLAQLASLAAPLKHVGGTR